MSPRHGRADRSEKTQLEKVAQAITDGGSVDWDAELASAPDDLVAALERLRQLGSICGALRSLAVLHREGESPQPGASPAVSFSPSGPEPARRLYRWGHLDVFEQVGRGSFGDVHLAIDTKLERKVALKLWRRQAGASPRHFLDEARGLARVTHPNVVVVYGAGVHRGRAGFWTEFVEGKTLAALLVERGPFDAEGATRIALDLCRALAAVHGAGLTHGDLKAENVMRTPDGRVVLMDFGAASRFGNAAGLGGTFVTPLAAAPEVLAGEPPRPSADVYALAALLFRLLTHAHPVAAGNWTELLERHRAGECARLSDLRPGLPRELLEVVQRGLSKDPRARYQSAGEIEGALRIALHGYSGAPRREVGRSVRALQRELGRVPEQLCRRIGREAALALGTLHGAGRVHGALRPESLHLEADGGVRLDPHADASGSGATPAADVRALGSVLYELATGEAPSRPPDRAGERNVQLSLFFEEIVHHLLAGEGEAMSAPEVARVLLDGEQGEWWRRRARALRLVAKKPLRRVRMPRDTRLYGRGEPLARLEHAWKCARSGDGRVVLVLGEAGIGKSRLVDELVGGLERSSEDFHALFGPHVPGGGQTGLAAFVTAYGEQLGHERLAETIEEYLPDRPLLVTVLSALLAGQPSAADRVSRDALYTAFGLVTQALAAERPTLVWIDDLHFASDEGRALFVSLAAAVAGHRVLLVGTSRPSLPEGWTASLERLEHVASIELPRLSVRDVLQLLSEAFGSESVATELATALGGRSNGNPFFLFEILRALEERYVVTRGPRGERARATPLHGVPIPSSIQQLVQGRVAALDNEEERELLDVACCAGFEFDPTLVTEAAHVDGVRGLRHLARIGARHGLVRPSGSAYVFDHHQIQELLYEALAEPLKKHYHTALARALRARVGDPIDLATTDGSVIVAVCDHELRGREPARALPLLAPALDHLEARYASQAAIALTGRALVIPGLVEGAARARILLRRGVRLSFVGRREEAQAAFEEALALVSATPETALLSEIERELAVQQRVLGRFDEARVLLESAVEHARGAGDARGESASHRELGTVLFHTGRSAEAETAYARSIVLAERAGDDAGLCASHSDLGELLGSLGRFTEAEPHLRAAIAGARACKNLALEIRVQATLGVLLVDVGRLEEGLAAHETVLELSHGIGLRTGESLARVNIGSVLPALGRYAEARRLLEDVVRLAPEIRAHDHAVAALSSLGTIYGVCGEFARAYEAFDRMERLATDLGFVWADGETPAGRGGIAEMQGDDASAAHHLATAAAVYAERGNIPRRAATLAALGRVLASRGRGDEARIHLAEAARLAEEIGSVQEAARSAIEHALLDGDAPTAAARLERDARCLPHWETLRIRERLFRVTGDRAHLEEARRLLAEVEASVSGDPSSALDEVPLYRLVREAAER